MANKYDYLVIMQGNYGHGWEDLCAETDDYNGIKEIRKRRKEYLANEGGYYRIIRRRELANN